MSGASLIHGIDGLLLGVGFRSGLCQSTARYRLGLFAVIVAPQDITGGCGNLAARLL